MQVRTLGKSLHVIEGLTVSFYGAPYPTRMSVVQLRGGGLFVHSPIELTDEVRSYVEGLGTVQLLISPNMIHHLDGAVGRRLAPRQSFGRLRAFERNDQNSTFTETSSVHQKRPGPTKQINLSLMEAKSWTKSCSFTENQRIHECRATERAVFSRLYFLAVVCFQTGSDGNPFGMLVPARMGFQAARRCPSISRARSGTHSPEFGKNAC